MGRKTSVYLPGELSEALNSSGLTIAEALRRGLDAKPPDERLARLAAQDAVESVAADIRQVIHDEVRSAFRDLQGGSW